MVSFFNKQRFGAVASVVTTLLIASGCRSASVNSNSGLNSSPGVGPFAPFYRSFERSPQPVDENSSPSGLEPVPPSVLPPPGYSEPEVPPEPPIPPSPSAKKSKWNLIPSSFKFPSLTRQNNQINQTGSKSFDRPVREKRDEVASIATSVRDQDEDLKTETVSARVTVRSRRCELAPPTASESEIIITPGPSASRVEDDTSLSTLKPPIKTRYGVIRQWPNVRESSNVPADSFEPEKLKTTEPVGLPANEPGLPISTGEVPSLLPPNL